MTSPHQGPDPSVGAAPRTPSPEGFIPTPRLPSEAVAATSLRLGFPLFLGHQPHSNPLCWCHSLGLVSAPSWGRQQHIELFGADTHKTAFPFSINSTKRLPQMMNSSPKSLYQPLEALRVLVKWLKPFPLQVPTGLWQRLSAGAEPSASSSQKRTFHCLGDLQSW